MSVKKAIAVIVAAVLTMTLMPAAAFGVAGERMSWALQDIASPAVDLVASAQVDSQPAFDSTSPSIAAASLKAGTLATTSEGDGVVSDSLATHAFLKDGVLTFVKATSVSPAENDNSRWSSNRVENGTISYTDLGGTFHTVGDAILYKSIDNAQKKWWATNDGKNDYPLITRIDFQAKIQPTGLGSWCNGFSQLEAVTNVQNIDWSNVTNANSMFEGCKSLYQYGNELGVINLSGWNAPKLNNAEKMFYNTTQDAALPEGLEGIVVKMNNISLGNDNSSSSNGFSRMFQGAIKITAVDFSNAVLPNVKNFSTVFRDCAGLKAVSLQNVSAPLLSTMEGALAACAALEYAALDNLELNGNNSDVVSMKQMCYSCPNLSYFRMSIHGKAGDMTKIDMTEMFDQSKVGTSSLADSSFLQSLGDVRPTKMTRCFLDAPFKTASLAGLDLSALTDMNNMFNGCTRLREVDLGNSWTSALTDTSNMFRRCANLWSVDMSDLDTTNVTNGADMFADCAMLDEVVLGENFRFQNGISLLKKSEGSGYDDLWRKVSPESDLPDQTTAMLAANYQGGEIWSGTWRAVHNYTSAVLDEGGVLTFKQYKGGIPPSEIDGRKVVRAYPVRPDNRNNRAIKTQEAGCLWLEHIRDIKKVVFTEEVHPGSIAYWFDGCVNLTEIDGLDKLNTQYMQQFLHAFDSCSRLTELDLSSINARSAQDMTDMFAGCSSLLRVKLGDDFSFKGTVSDTSKQALLPASDGGKWISEAVGATAVSPTDLRDKYGIDSGLNYSSGWYSRLGKGMWFPDVTVRLVGPGVALKTGGVTASLYEGDSFLQSATNDASGAFSFKEVEFPDIGTRTFTVKLTSYSSDYEPVVGSGAIEAVATATEYEGGIRVTPQASSLDLFLRYVRVQASAYMVSFDRNRGGDGLPEVRGQDMAPVTVDGGLAFTVPMCTFTRENYRFDGWNEKEDGSGTAHPVGSSFVPSADTTLYAQWKVVQLVFTVPLSIDYSMSPDGELSGPTDDSVYIENKGDAGLSITNLTTNEKTGYTIVADDPSGGSLDDGQMYLEMAPKTEDGAVGQRISLGAFKDSSRTQTLAPGEWAVPKLKKLILAGLSGKCARNDSLSDSQISVGSLAWDFAVNNVTVSYDAAGGAGAMESQVVPADVEFAAPDCAFTCEGKAFKGWSSTAWGSVERRPGDVVSFSADTVLYAVWE